MVKYLKVKEAGMPSANLKERLIEDIVTLPDKKVKEVLDFVEYLKLKEDDWFINFVNKRGKLAKSEKKAGEKFIRLGVLQKEYR
jgi:hypothetical protein